MGILTLLVIAVFIVLRYYEDDVVNYAMNQAKTKFKTRVEFGPADLAFWETFPNASLRFTDVYVEETFGTKDTLLFAKKVYLEFNLFDLFRGNYDIQAIDASDALCMMKVDNKGNDNWHFWIEEEAGRASSDTSEFKMEMEELKLTNSNVTYDNLTSQFFISLTSDKSIAKGNFTGQQFTLEVEAGALVHLLKNKNDTYADNQTLTAEATLEVDNAKDEFTITESEFNWGKAQFNVSGAMNFSDKPKTDLRIEARELDLEDVKESLPASFKKTLNAYNADGELNLDITLKQEGEKRYDVNATCTITDGELEHDDSGVALDDITCELKYLSKYPAEILTIRSMKAKMNTGYLEANGTIKNFDSPDLDIQLSAQAELNDLKKFFGWDKLEVCTGSLRASASLKGKLTYAEEDSAYNWGALQTNGEARLQEVVLRMQHSNREFRGLQALVNFSNKDAHVQNLAGTVNGSDFNITGSILNLIPFLASKDEKVTLNATLNSQLIDFTNLVETSTSTSSNEDYHFELPERIHFRLNSSVKKFVFRTFEATDVKGIAELRNKKFIVDPVSFHTADGDFSAQLAFEQASDDMYRMNCLANLKSIDIQKLFTEFENFDQTFIQDKNLKGIANASVQFRTLLTTDLDIVQDKIESLIDISIENGELNNLESLQDIASYIRSNKWAAPFVDEDKFAEKMKNIKFSKLENVIEIKDKLITIPQMDIRSTAMDISAKGTHTFDNAIDYTIGFSLRDVLVRRETEWQVADDGLGKRMFVSMKGTTDNPVFNIDKDAAKENRQEEMQAEKQNVKALLKEEFGLFKKDNSIGTFKETVTPSGSTTTLEWDGFDEKKEEKKTTTTPPEKKEEKKDEPAKTTDPKKKKPKWLEEKK